MIRLTVDGLDVEVPEGSTVLDAARKLGILIPTLCHLPGVKEHKPSCLACVVRINGDRRVVPSCATRAVDGMVVASDADDVRAMRKAALELLFSDHLGDCVAICERVCPAGLHIPVVIRLVALGRMRDAIDLARTSAVFPGILGRICRAPCQNACRRRQHDGAIEIKSIERAVADHDRTGGQPFVPHCAPSTGRRVAIVGAGATGLSAAFHLLRAGHACVVFDDQAEPGGALRRETTPEDLPRDVLDAEIAVIRAMGLALRAGTMLGRDVRLDELAGSFDAVILAVGELRRTNGGELGVVSTEQGVRIDAASMMTNVRGVFAGGTCVRSRHDPARSVGDGRLLADCVAAYLAGRKPMLPRKAFTSTIPRLSPEENLEITKGADATLAGHDLTTEAGHAAGRCWHCECRAATDCRLRVFGAANGVDVREFAGGKRRAFAFIRQPGGVIFEPGKCISCGICVELAAKAREPLGLTFIGRGFDVKIGVPLSGELSDALRQAAEDCVRFCPTGALAFEDDERTTAVRATGLALPGRPAP